MLSQLQESINALLIGLDSNNENATRDAIFTIKRSQWAEKSMQGEVFAALIEVLTSNIALQSKYTCLVVLYFESSFKLLDSEQKRQLLSLIESKYGLYKDWMVQFSFLEILGEKFSNIESLNVVRRLNKKVRGKLRLFIPHAFEHHVTDSQSKLVQAIAFNELKKLQFRQPIEVIRETKISLIRVNRRKNEFSLKHIKR